MADFFNNRRGSRDDGYDNRDDYSQNGGNNFDRRYSSDRNGGYFGRNDNRNTRSTRAGDDRLNRVLPPIEQYNQTQFVQQTPPMQPNYQQNPMQNMPSNMQQMQSSMQPQVFSMNNVVLFSPKSYADVQTLIDHLRRREPAIVEFANVGDESGQRILDFLSGAIYALGGSMQRVSGTIFLLTPAGVSISAGGDITKTIEEKRNKR